MANKMRVSMHNGRGSSKHNDRSFLKSWTHDERQEKAGHIDHTKTKDNFYWATSKADKNFQDGATFEEIELNFYEKFFGEALEQTNRNYIAQGHPERVKTMLDWYKSKQKAPFETILQVGDMTSDIDPEIFKKMCFDYVNHINRNYGQNIRVLDVAIHFDETSPHMHLRQVYSYTDGGIAKIGQAKALEQLGIELPDPTKKTGRNNNRKMTLDKQLRQEWQNIAKSYGFDIETTPRVGVRHKEKEQFIDDQIAKKQSELDRLNKTIDDVIKNSNTRAFKSFKKRLGAFGYCLIPNQDLDALKSDYKALESKSQSLETKVKILQVDSDELKKLKDNPQRLISEARGKSKDIIKQAETEANNIVKSAKMELREYTDLRNFKAHWERIENKFPQRVQALEDDYQRTKNKSKNRSHKEDFGNH